MRKGSLLFVPATISFLFGGFLFAALINRISRDLLTQHDAIGFAAGLIMSALILFLCFDKIRASARDDRATRYFREDLGMN